MACNELACFVQHILFSSLQNSNFKNIVSDRLIHFGLCFAIAVSCFAQIPIDMVRLWDDVKQNLCWEEKKNHSKSQREVQTHYVREKAIKLCDKRALFENVYAEF